MSRTKLLQTDKFLRLLLTVLLISSITLHWSGAQETAETESHEGFSIERDADVPDLPFADNPDPTLCGIPQPWGEDEPAWLSGHYEGKLIQAEVLLYDSHLRRSVVGSAPTGTEIQIVLSQANPNLNYYLVRTLGLEKNIEGWIPAPFVSFEQSKG